MGPIHAKCTWVYGDVQPISRHLRQNESRCGELKGKSIFSPCPVNIVHDAFPSFAKMHVGYTQVKCANGYRLKPMPGLIHYNL
jgi:hypothetical protein